MFTSTRHRVGVTTLKKFFVFNKLVFARVCVIIREKFILKLFHFLPLDWANFDDVATESVPVAMDTSPWSQSSTSAEASSSSEKTEKWADFSNKIPQNEEAKDNWADFNDIKDLSRLRNFNGHFVFCRKSKSIHGKKPPLLCWKCKLSHIHMESQM